MFTKGEIVKGVKDLPFIWFTPLNEYYIANINQRNNLIIFSSITLDSLLLIAFYRWTRYSSSYRLPLANVFFYITRAICQKLIVIEYPEGYNWGYPGFFSFSIPYGETNDFFYSGHVGICIVQYLEFNAVGWKYAGRFSLFVCCVQIYMMLVLRAHYTMDMIAAIIFAHYFWLMGDRYCYLIDWKLFKIPLYKRMPYYKIENYDPQFNKI